jgi:hypothetical protein
VQPRFTASEPTRSLFAAALVLLMVQAMACGALSGAGHRAGQ